MSINKYKSRFNQILEYRYYTEADDPSKETADETPDIEQTPETDTPSDQTGDTPEEFDFTVPEDETTSPGEEVAPAGEQTMELDVTELVNTNKDILTKVEKTQEDILTSHRNVEKAFEKLQKMETSLNNMADAIKIIDDLRLEVSRLRPPTEDERRAALAKDSYPFNIPINQYNSQNAPKTQTDLEKKQMTLWNAINSYNEMDTQKSFDMTQQDDIMLTNFNPLN
jgi:hypothetical protein